MTIKFPKPNPKGHQHLKINKTEEPAKEIEKWHSMYNVLFIYLVFP